MRRCPTRPTRRWARALAFLLALATAASGALAAGFPPRPAGAPTGSAFIASLLDLEPEARESAALAELLRGNLPDRLRRFVPVEIEAQDRAGRAHRASLEVMPDYLAVGSDRDFVRMPLRPATAQAVCDAFGLALPTRKLVEEVWRRAAVRPWPQPLVLERESPATFLRHSRLVDEQLRGARAGSLVAGVKKDIVITPRLSEQPGRVAIFGWHKPTGEAIQPLSLVHRDSYVDYSHGVRPVKRRLLVDGLERDYADLLRDAELHLLLSDEGEVAEPRYGGAPAGQLGYRR